MNTTDDAIKKPRFTLVEDVSIFLRSLNFSRGEKIFLKVIMAFLALLLFIGYKGDVPYCPENEETFYADPALRMAVYNSLDPENYINPASTLVYPLAFYYKMLQLFTGPTFVDDKLETFNLLFVHMEALCQWPRLMSMAISLATIPILYVFGRRWMGPFTAGIGVIIYVCCRLIIFYSTIVRPDMLSLLFITLTLLLMDVLFEQIRNKSIPLLLGITTGLALSTRFFCLALVPPVLLIYGSAYLQSKNNVLKKTLVLNTLKFLATWFTTFALTSPYVLINFSEFKKQIQFEADSKFTNITGLSPLDNLKWYISDGFPYAIADGFTHMLEVGLFFALFDRRPKTRVYLFTFAIFLIGTCLNPRHWERWTLPMLPIGTFLIAYSFTQGYKIFVWILRRVQIPELVATKFPALVLTLFGLLYGFYEFRDAVKEDYLKTHLSAPAAMYLYMLEHIPKGTKIALAEGWDFPNRDYFELREHIWRPDFVPPRDHSYRTPRDVARDGYKYMLIQHWDRDYWLSDIGKEQYPDEYNFYRELVAHVPLVWDGLRPDDNAIVLGQPVGCRWSPLALYDLRGLVPNKEKHEKK